MIVFRSSCKFSTISTIYIPLYLFLLSLIVVNITNAQTFIWPALDGSGNLNSRVTQDYSEYNSIGNNKYHPGIDIGANPIGATNNTVRATASGIIYSIKYHPDSWGNAIMINHGEGIYSLYGHLASFSQSWSVGQSVSSGQQLGIMGTTGSSTGIHLHFEIKPSSSWNHSDGAYTNDIPDGYGYKDARIYMTPYSESTITPVVVRVTSTVNLNVRSGPTTSYARITQLQPNQKFVAFKQNSDWYKMYLPNAMGTVSGWSIKSSALVAEPSTKQVRIYNTGGTGLFVRTGAGTNYTQVKTKNNLDEMKVWDNQRFPVIEQSIVGSTVWYKIDLPTSASQSFGWISGDFATNLETYEHNMPAQYLLCQNYPNPFNPTTIISYSIPNTENVSLKVYDLLGNEISSIVNEEKSPGSYSIEFDGSNLASGIYFYSLTAGGFHQTNKMILAK